MAYVKVIGGGLAETEAALQLAGEGVKVELYETKESGCLAELACSADFGSVDNSNPETFLNLKEKLLKNASFIIK